MFFARAMLAHQGFDTLHHQLLQEIPSDPLQAGHLAARHFTALENAIVEDCIEWCRKWKYDPSIAEYFVETQTKAIVRQSELKKITQQMESENAAAAPRPT